MAGVFLTIFQKYAQCKPLIQDQGDCGSCWAFSTTGVLAQRMCIASKGKVSGLALSPQDQITCDNSCYNQYGQACTIGSDNCICPFISNLTSRPFFPKWRKIQGAGAKTRLESRIKKFTPHCVCRPGWLRRRLHIIRI